MGNLFKIKLLNMDIEIEKVNKNKTMVRILEARNGLTGLNFISP